MDAFGPGILGSGRTVRSPNNVGGVCQPGGGTDIGQRHAIHLSQQGADRKLRLGPWIAEFEAILAFIRKGLPFFVSLPTDDGIVRGRLGVGAYRRVWGYCKVRSFVEPRLMRNVSSPFDPVTDSLFWKPILHYRVGTLEGRRSSSRRLIGLDRRVRNTTVIFFSF